MPHTEKIRIIRVVVEKPIIDRRDWVKYLVWPVWHEKAIDEGFLTSSALEKLSTKIEEHVHQYITNKKEPPPEIASAIINIADDYLSGRPMQIRAGDYIALQNYMRSQSPR